MPGSRRFARRRRSRIGAACPNRRHARDCMTRFFAGTACGSLPEPPAALCRNRLRRLAGCSSRDEVLAMLAGRGPGRWRAGPPMSPTALVLVVRPRWRSRCCCRRSAARSPRLQSVPPTVVTGSSTWPGG